MKIFGMQRFLSSYKRLTISEKKPKNFLLLIDDFFLAYIENTEMLHIKVLGYSCLELNYSVIRSKERFFDGLIGKKLPIQQVYFLDRRLVQFRKEKWEFDCFS